MYNTEIDKKERNKIIAIAAAAATLILVLVVAIIVVATKKPAENIGGNENSSFAIEEENEGEAVEEPTEETESGASELGSLTTETIVAEEPTTDKAPAEIASTGPEDILPVALVLGILTTAATAVVMKKAEK